MVDPRESRSSAADAGGSAPGGRERRPGEETGTGDAEGEQGRQARFRRMFMELIDSGHAFRSAGQDLVSGVAQGTKEEVMRIVSAEVRGFLDKMDVADLFQEIVSGLVIDVKTEIRFARAADGKLQPQITGAETTVRTRAERAEAQRAAATATASSGGEDPRKPREAG